METNTQIARYLSVSAWWSPTVTKFGKYLVDTMKYTIAHPRYSEVQVNMSATWVYGYFHHHSNYSYTNSIFTKVYSYEKLAIVHKKIIIKNIQGLPWIFSYIILFPFVIYSFNYC